MMVTAMGKRGSEPVETGRTGRIAWWAGAAGVWFLLAIVFGFVAAHAGQDKEIFDDGEHHG